MPKRRKPIARDSKKNAASVSGQKIELSLGEKLKAAGITGAVPNRDDPADQRVDCDSHCDRDSESNSDKPSADSDELGRAYLGVKRLRRRMNRRVRKHEASTDVVGTGYDPLGIRLAGAREGDLLAEPDFEISWDRDGDVTGLRRGFESQELNSLFDSRLRPEAILDLHGIGAADLDRKVTQFVLFQRRRGVRRLLFVHGKGKHSKEGIAVLGDRLVKVLSQGRVSRYVRGFCTASLEHGGSGALAVLLERFSID